MQERLADGAFYCSRQCQKDDWKKHKAWHEGMAQLLASAKPSSEHQPEAYGELLKTGLRQIASGDHSAGVATFKSCIQMRPDQAAAHANLGMALRDRGDFVGALPCLLRAVELYEEGTEQWGNDVSRRLVCFCEQRREWCRADRRSWRGCRTPAPSLVDNT